MPDLPSGTVAFLFTDVEGSTARWERDRAAMAAAVARHLDILRAAVAAHDGVVFKVIGDAVQAAFPGAPAAVAAAVDAQQALLAEPWLDGEPLRVRMALHAGEAAPDPHGDYLAPVLNRLARLMAAGHGGQILVSQAIQQLTRGDLPPAVSLRDLGEHRLRDLLEPERIWQVVAPGLEERFPPLETLERRRHNLPRQPTPFLGRLDEVEAVAALLRRDAVQLVTLTGPGGIGKTRLALQTAVESLDAFPDGVFFVDLASLSDPAQIAAAISSVLGLSQEGERPPADVVAAYLTDKQVLLLLDNFEHLLDGAATVADLLRGCPDLTVLATSRAPLRLRAEREFPVQPLGVPESDQSVGPDHLARYDAVRLFLDRAVTAKPDFSLDAANAAAVAEICRRLDGLPLAIELAAARVRILPPRTLLARLEQRLALLTDGARDAPHRQRTLRDAIAWSHDLLSPDEQTVFRRLGAFVGGCTLEAAEAVAGPDADADVFAGLTGLVEESLLRQEAGPQDEPRFRMLETIREFALEQLAQSGEEEVVRARHAEWLLDRARDISVILEARYAVDLVDRLEAEYANLVAALGWLSRSGEGERFLALAAAMGEIWYLTGRHREGRDWLERALTVAPAEPTRERGIALLEAGRFAHHHGDDVTAIAHIDEAEALLRPLGQPMDQGYANMMRGIVEEDRGEYDPAESRFLAARDFFRQSGAATAAAVADYHLAIVAYGRGETDRARELWETVAAELRTQDDTVAIVWCLGYLALLAVEQGEVGPAVDSLREAVALSEPAALRHQQDMTLEVAAMLGAASGLAEAAARLQGAAAAIGEGRRNELPEGLAYQRTERQLRAILGDGGYDRAWREGMALRPEGVEAALEAVLAAASAHETEATADEGNSHLSPVAAPSPDPPPAPR
jgi:predicted ATPase/class 3 adenylate cyclase